MHTNSMEQLQEGYVSAIAATAGVSFQPVFKDMHRYDVQLVRQPDPTVEEVAIRLQLKSTTSISVPRPGTSSMSYQFKSREAFDALAMKREHVKHILLLMVVHQNQNRWTYSHHRAMVLRHCCYWVNLEGQTSSAQFPTVSVPTANIFDAAALTGMMDRVEGGQPI